MYTAAVMLNQPWALSRVAELHRHALFVGFNMLDTIAWDIMYVSDQSLDSLWKFVARLSDVLFYDSQFTQGRFRARFSPQGLITECVTYLSFAADEQVDEGSSLPVSCDILLIGNEYDHKDLVRTLQVLADAFPFNKIVAIGANRSSAQNVTVMPSGNLEQSALHGLFASAGVIVFPSFYEGFGLPVVQGLAHGRTVIVRESELWHEIAGQLRLPGQMVPFHDLTSLIESVGRALGGLPLSTIPQGTALGENERPLRWKDCASRIIRALEQLLSNPDGKRWMEREEALRSVELLRV
jgi:glycosyltransferase involved in cell wall biosynthesis